MTTRNTNLEELNNFVVDFIPCDATRSASADKIDNAKEDKLRYPVKLLNGIPETVSLPDHHIMLKKRYVVTLLRSFQPKTVI